MKNEAKHVSEIAEPGANLLVLREVRGNEPVTLNASQQALLPYANALYVAWWVIWLGMLIVISVQHLLLPLMQKLAQKPEREEVR